MLRILTATVSVVSVFVSLMTFPAGLPWMVGLWMLFAMLRYHRQKPIWIPLLCCGTILLIKRPGFTIEFVLLELVIFGVLIADLVDRRDRSQPSVQRMLLFGVLLFVGCGMFAFLRHESSTTRRFRQPDQRPVVCLGDSLTDYGYPQELGKRISLGVKDFGFDGITTAEGINLLPEMLATNPQAVVVELGGHDFNQQESREQTRENLIKLIEAFREQDAEVILVEIPHGFITDPYDGLERELAGKYDLQLISDSIIRSFVLNSPVMPPGTWMNKSSHLSSDGLHPNRRGNERFAQVVAQALAKVFGDEILVD